MKEIWVLTVKTSLPDVCYNSKDMTTTCKAFDSFEKGRNAFRETVKKFAFSKNSMFDGNGNIKYLTEYVKGCDDEVYDDDDILNAECLNYVINSLRDAFSGKNVDFEMESEYYTDYMIDIATRPGEVAFGGADDGPCNGYDPDLRTNIFSMEQEKNYFLYIDDCLGQPDRSSKLYIDLQKTEIS